MFNNLRELILSMPTEETCREYLVQQRWNGKPVCPYCGYGRAYSIEKGKRYKCASKDCYKKFSATVGTIFEASNVPLVKWFTAIYLIGNHKKGISSYQLARDIGVSQTTGWFMLHRIREMMRPKDNVKLDNIVEVDETWIGGIVGNMSKSKRARLRTETGGTIQNKTMVVGLLERSGNLKLVAMGKEAGQHILQPLVKDNVGKDAVIMTDSSTGYDGLNKTFAGHEVVNHTNQEYVRDGGIHTNSIEGAFSLLKRSIVGIYHQVTPKHLSRYCDETMYRYNTRKINDAARFTLSLQQVEGRLTYKTLINTPLYTPQGFPLSKPNYVIVAGRKTTPVYQLKDGVIVAQFPTITKAAQITGIKKRAILGVLKGRKKTTGGFVFVYA